MVVKTRGSIKKIVDLTPTVRHFVLELEDEMEYVAGQFVNLSFNEEGELFRKPYSICSEPTNNREIELCIKLVEDGKVTPRLWKKKEGDKVDIMGPLGMFTCQESKKNSLIFIGTGTGVGPLRGIIKDLLTKKVEKNITLILGVRYQNEILYDKEFENLTKKNPNFKFVKVISRPTENWEGRVGHVQDNLEGIDVLNSEAYICGLPIMVETTSEKLIKLGMEESCVHHEKYV